MKVPSLLHWRHLMRYSLLLPFRTPNEARTLHSQPSIVPRRSRYCDTSLLVSSSISEWARLEIPSVTIRGSFSRPTISNPSSPLIASAVINQNTTSLFNSMIDEKDHQEYEDRRGRRGSRVISWEEQNESKLVIVLYVLRPLVSSNVTAHLLSRAIDTMVALSFVELSISLSQTTCYLWMRLNDKHCLLNTWSLSAISTWLYSSFTCQGLAVVHFVGPCIHWVNLLACSLLVLRMFYVRATHGSLFCFCVYF